MTNSIWGGKSLSMKVIGTCAGTFMDGIDIVHIHFSQEHPEAQLKWSFSTTANTPLERVMKIIKFNTTSPEEIAIVNIQLGEFTADAIIQFAFEQGFSLEHDVDIIAGQGQTIWHLPLPEMFEGDQIRAHLDMAEISMIAAKTGGVPAFVAWDALCATHPTLNCAVQNIRGIANITLLPAGDRKAGYDQEMCLLMVRCGSLRTVKQYDKDGEMGKGKVDQAIVDEILAGPYFVHDIPKTTGRETFVTRRWIRALGPPGGIQEIYLGSGGSYNPNIINYLRERFPETKIAFLDEIGIPCGSREAMDFAFKGLECIVGGSLIVPKNVESDRAGIIGQIQPGDGTRYHMLLKHVQEFWGEYPIEKRMDPVLDMEIVRRGKKVNGVNGVANGN
ncbi:hypothetical protein BDD12DRAFT_879318 [Trichophaea hybrida]|nr:hypothetical protein BDD12DRAFT_879318 [Trichophaea hybrida]